MSKKFLYWNNATSATGSSFGYSRTLTDEQKAHLIPGSTMIFGITYKSASAPGVTISNLRVCSASSLTPTAIPLSSTLETITSGQIATKYYSITLPSSLTGNVVSFSLSFTASVTILDTALFHGSALMMKFVQNPDGFAQFVKYDSGWKIRTGTGDNDFVGLTTATDLTAHNNLATGVHGVGTGQVVGTTKTQTLENKALVSPILNNGVSGSAIVKTADKDITANINDTKVYTTKAVKDLIADITSGESVAEHNVVPENATVGQTVHGMTQNDGEFVSTIKEQELKNKTLALNEGNKIGGYLITGIDSDISNGSNEHLPTNRSVLDYLTSVFVPVYLDYQYPEHTSAGTIIDSTTKLLKKYSSAIVNNSHISILNPGDETINDIKFDSTTINATDYLIVKLPKKGTYSIVYYSEKMTGNFGGGRGTYQNECARMCWIKKNAQNNIYFVKNTNYSRAFYRQIVDSDDGLNFMISATTITKEVYCDGDPIYVVFLADGPLEFFATNITIHYTPVI